MEIGGNDWNIVNNNKLKKKNKWFKLRQLKKNYKFDKKLLNNFIRQMYFLRQYIVENIS